MKPYAFGVDIGGTTVKMGLFTSDGRLLEDWEIPTRTSDGGAHILHDIRDSIMERLSERGISPDELEGVGIGVPGPVRADGTVSGCVNLGWGAFDVAQRFREMMAVKCFVGNDANVAALGEMWQGGGRGHRDIVMVTLGTGVGGGVVLDGKIVSGTRGSAGEIGHLPICDDEPMACGCGKHGCLEQYASATGIVRLAKLYLAEHPDVETALQGNAGLDAKAVFDAARSGDEVALRLVEQVGHLLGKALASVACVLDPEVFVIGGGVSKAGDILLEAIERGYRIFAFSPSCDVEFKLAQLGNRAGLYGGAWMALQGSAAR